MCEFSKSNSSTCCQITDTHDTITSPWLQARDSISQNMSQVNHMQPGVFTAKNNFSNITPYEIVISLDKPFFLKTVTRQQLIVLSFINLTTLYFYTVLTHTHTHTHTHIVLQYKNTHKHQQYTHTHTYMHAFTHTSTVYTYTHTTSISLYIDCHLIIDTLRSFVLQLLSILLHI